MRASNNTLSSQTPTPSTSRKPRVLKWRVVDIVVASVIGVASGVIFWAWGLAWSPLSALLAFTPGLEGLLAGGWLFAGVLGGLIIRKPGAAVYTEVIAAVVSMLIGTQWGFSTLIWGVVEGLGAELVLALFFYSNWRLGVALLAGAGAGVAVGLLDTTFTSYAALDIGYKAVYFVSAVVSGTVLAGLLSWLAVRGLARTGALSRFAAGRESGPTDRALSQPAQ
ncbi:ECF transporter S component [Cryobacterium sp. SO1]|uniref:ECF transporter S component n=1 Tax=Cryobacterium sp. SO1 TaxID=1897061 RepID=UPI0010ED799F|nr:ECF transporter S component [Cryobacterium sp. SO1]RZI34432.1 putative HMP/thiamine permease protein YkoE [Cryobacterium sp. SO1]